MSIIDSLNDEQQDALRSTDGINLVTAGAGTGKTRLLTHRIAYLIQEKGVDPYNILAITFTNKAANEMKTRVEALVNGGDRVWISTFHSMCVKILKRDIEKLGGNYDRNFTIYSDTDTEKLLKTILKEFGIEDEVKKFSFHISNCKNKNMTLVQYHKEFEGMRGIDEIMRVFRAYEENLEKNNALDFDDLLVKTFDLFVKNPDVLDFYARRFEYVLVDEFQDTNKIQLDLVNKLTSYHNKLFVVGDEDQSIYSWRGADFTLFVNFKKYFPNVKVFKLQQNYRCTQNILNAANQLIALNDERFDKKLWTNKKSDEKISYKKYYDESEEATNIASTIYSLVERHGYNYSDIAILVRLNALTMQLEEKLLSYNIPHKIYGGFKFFERAEIKNILAYLRIFINPKDEVSLLRIINFPKRSIGDSAIAKLKEIAYVHGESVLDVILNMEMYEEAKSYYNKLREFRDTYLDLKQSMENLPLDDFVESVIDGFKIKEAYPKTDEDNIDKQMNIGQFVNSVKSFIENNPNSTLSDYLESVTLQSDIDTMGDSDNVAVATVHAVKGLEFKVVFVVGMEEGIFPLSRCKENPKDLQEERRLAYVAFTRAGEKLYVSSCKTRFLYGRRSYQAKSQFIDEAGLIPPRPLYESPRATLDGFYKNDNCDWDNRQRNYNYKESNRKQDVPLEDTYYYDYDGLNKYDSYGGVSYYNQNKNKSFGSGFTGYNTKTNVYVPKPSGQGMYTSQTSTSTIDTSKYKVGQVVEHPKFRTGTIKSIGDGGKTADIDFGGLGVKTLMLEIAKLTIIN